ncbi:MAG: CCA tRNA nucleotidyltransferase [Eubacteriales bacterium]
MDIPRKPMKILSELCKNGYKCHLVGGCVRDGLLGRPIHDWDMTTSALPQQVMAVFPKTVPTGIAHGTVTVVWEGEHFEVTTYRTDGDYDDNRHPESVQFVTNLAEDLARRDFTINAMALDMDGNLTDLYGGQDDLRDGLIRCVGDPRRRFQEDALRMLRCVRFSAQLGFEIEDSTEKAMESLAFLCETLSVERVRDEVEKALLSPNPEKVADMAKLGLLVPWIGRKILDLSHLQALPPARIIRWAGLCQAVPELDLKAMRLDKKSAEIATKSAQNPCPTRQLDLKILISQQGWEVARCTANLWGQTAQLETISNRGDCVLLGDLAVNGSDFPQLQGRKIGQLLQKLLSHVLVHPEDNQRQILLALGQQTER